MRAITRPISALPQQLIQELARLGHDGRAKGLGLAVSGGSDSLALLHLAHQAGLVLRVATVDHRLRPNSGDEARHVGQIARDLGLNHDILPWQGWDGRGNIQDQARRARRNLLANWAQAHQLGAVALAHTRDDLAENFIMRLARGAGVDGLAAMAPRFTHANAVFLRPLLWAGRADLRAYLASLGVAWIDDPSNDMLRFDRVRIRRKMPDLAQIGLTAPVLADIAQHMAQARQALDAALQDLARATICENAGILTLSPEWKNAPPELQRRLIALVILWIAPADYPPRGAALARALAGLQNGQALQLGGCHFLPHRGQIIAFREVARCAPPCPPAQIWDGVWHYSGPDLGQALQIRALGAQGLLQWPDWRATSLPKAALLSQPSLWQGARLLATPLQENASQSAAFFRQPTPYHLFHEITD